MTDQSKAKNEHLSPGNKFDIPEWSGAFGDLGTLIPFVIGYISVVNLDPLGILSMFGLMLIASGIVYKTPMPIQPMKAIGAAAISQGMLVSQNLVWGAGLFTGFFWLLAGLTGILDFISRITSRPVVQGIVLGLGLSFMIQGIKMMQRDFIIAASALLITLLLLSSRRLPAMLVLLFFGLAAAVWRNPHLLNNLSLIHPEFRMPAFALGKMTWSDFWQGAVILGLAQIPLTLGNAVIATASENNRRFPAYPVSERKVAVFQGIINLIAPVWGGIPMCHGAGGMAAHARFGARTGGSVIILGTLLLVAALFFSDSVLLFFTLIPTSVLGVLIFFAGLDLAVSVRNAGDVRDNNYLLMLTAGFAFFNAALGFAAGLFIQELLKRNIIKL